IDSRSSSAHPGTAVPGRPRTPAVPATLRIGSLEQTLKIPSAEQSWDNAPTIELLIRLRSGCRTVLGQADTVQETSGDRMPRNRSPSALKRGTWQGVARHQ